MRYCFEKNAHEGLNYGKDDGLRYRSTHPTGLCPFKKRGVLAASFRGCRVSRRDMRYCFEKNAHEGLNYGKDDGLRYRSTHPTGLCPFKKRGVLAASFRGCRVSRRDVRYCYEKNAHEGLNYGKDDGLRYRSTHPTGLCPFKKGGVLAASFRGFRVSRRDVRYL